MFSAAHQVQLCFKIRHKKLNYIYLDTTTHQFASVHAVSVYLDRKYC